MHFRVTKIHHNQTNRFASATVYTYIYSVHLSHPPQQRIAKLSKNLLPKKKHTHTPAAFATSRDSGSTLLHFLSKRSSVYRGEKKEQRELCVCVSKKKKAHHPCPSIPAHNGKSSIYAHARARVNGAPNESESGEWKVVTSMCSRYICGQKGQQWFVRGKVRARCSGGSRCRGSFELKVVYMAIIRRRQC